MAGTEYYLYRVKFIKPAQLSLLLPSLSPSQVFLEAINEKPEMMLSSGSEWHLGNVDFFDQLTGSFAIGRTTKTTLEKFDKESGNFIDQLDDSSPYTTVVFDCRIGLLGIAKKSKLAPDAETVARRIRGLFEKSETVIHTGSEVKVNFIPDPQGFIQKLRAAYAIKSFKATFTGPNPVDADELFQKPLSVYAQQIGAQTGSLEVKGEALNEEVAESIAKSTAATANTASARIIPAEGKKVVPIRMKGDAVSVVVSLDASYRDVLARIQDEYSRVRG
ncbi:hypothetical protein BH581_11655 [Vibrio splendidus]|uniref:hypothetical protein n=1 Tax=Vibrio TaxID=662 RepID=UPI000978004B|nr:MULTISPECIES: hypothetical protein [Vibrio]MDN3679648.1 hypothetical protein [Vibrio tapetis subsp. quintayensis]OMO28090.1 hypothetical protein BH581_11655 [Vibrio splendidus]